MFKDIIKYNGKSYQLSTAKVNGIFETMIFPIENEVVSGNEVYCFRTCEPGKSLNKHRDIFKNYENYVSDEAIKKYLKKKEEMYMSENNPTINKPIFVEDNIESSIEYKEIIHAE